MRRIAPLFILSTGLLPATAQALANPNGNSNATCVASGGNEGSGSMGTCLLNKAIVAMGGPTNFQNMKGITFQSKGIYRSTSITQSYSLVNSDIFVAEAGGQTISYRFTPDNTQRHNFQQRIDREFAPSEYWIWADPTLLPLAYSLVVQDHNGDSYAYFVNGSNNFLFPTTPRGYADSGLAKVLVDEAAAMSPLLMWQMLNSNTSVGALQDILDGHGTKLPAVSNNDLGVTVFLDNSTFLPRFVRRNELNNVFGPSFADLYFSEWSAVPSPQDPSKNSSLILPRRYQTIYNGNYSEDTLVDTIALNPAFSAKQFAPISSQPDKVMNPNKTEAGQLPGYNTSEIGAFNHASLWAGPQIAAVSDLSATHPIPDLPQLWRLSFSDLNGNSTAPAAGDYAQLIVELDDGVLVADAPAHQSDIIFQWIDKNIGKPIKYVWPSHHHHDHAYGVIDYVRRGATLVIPEVARQYWSSLPTDNVTIQTYTEERPFVVSNANIQARGIWHPDPPHAQDWAYMLVTKACPKANDSMVLFEADTWDIGSDTQWPWENARQWLEDLVQDGIRMTNTLVVSAHGGNGLLKDLVGYTGFVYPQFGLKDLKAGGSICR